MEPSPAIKALASKWVGEFGIDIASMIAIKSAEKAIASSDRPQMSKNKALLETLLTYEGVNTGNVSATITRLESELNPAAAPAAGGRKRKMTRRYCKKTSCKKMGFTQKASCRPYKNCYKNKK